jgi:hypothetical protein
MFESRASISVSKAHFEAMNRAIVAMRTQPVADQIYAFNQARDALNTMEAGSHLAKIVIRIVAG